jgi:hypothetical protein
VCVCVDDLLWCDTCSLIATIKSARPDLLSHLYVTASPIPTQMPINHRKPIEFVDGIGEPTTAGFLQDCGSDVDPTGW